MFSCFCRRTMSTIIQKVNFPKNHFPFLCHFSASPSWKYQHHLIQCRTFRGVPYICNKHHQEPLNRQLALKSPSAHTYSNDARFTNHNFDVIYRFPYILHMHLVSRLKIYQTAISVTAVPLCYLMHSTGQLSLDLYYYVLGYSAIACVMLYVLSIYFRRLIGIIAYNSAEELVKVSHLTFWGGRNDIFLHVKSIIPISDMSDNPNDIFVKFRQYDEKGELYLVLKFGGIKDAEKLRLILGEIR